jgi:hypothetical protein
MVVLIEFRPLLIEQGLQSLLGDRYAQVGIEPLSGLIPINHQQCA